MTFIAQCAPGCNRSGFFGGHAVLALIALLGSPVHAQVQRTTINPGFETPRIGVPAVSGACQGDVFAGRVTGWKTTDAPLNSPTADFDSPNGCNDNPEAAPSSGPRVFEYFTTGTVDNQTSPTMAAANGRNFVEFNARTTWRLYQSVCLLAGETVAYSFNHLGRRNAAVVESASMRRSMPRLPKP